MQSYEPLVKRHKLVGFSGLKPLHHKFSFPLVKLFSPVDLPNFPYKMPILNRLCLGDAMYLWDLEEKLKGFDIAHVREIYFHFTQQVLNAKAKGYVKKVVCTCSETIPFNHEGIWYRHSFKQRAIKEVDLFHCLTQKAKECLVKEGCRPNKIIVFPYGIDLKRFKIYDSRFKNKNKRILNILFVGRLVKEKGIYDLLKAFVQLNKKYRNLRLTIVGNGPERLNLIGLISQIGLVRQIKIEQVGYEQMSSVYQNADIFCLLSKPTQHWEEYFGMAIVEAMACGLPVISTMSGGIPEVVGESGILVLPGNGQGIFNALTKLVNNAKLRKDLGTRAQKRAMKLFDSNKVAKNINDLWKQVK